MKSAFAAFERAIEELRWFVESLERERRAVRLLSNCEIDGDICNLLRDWERHISSSAVKRRFDYTSIVISLYSLLEHFVEGMVSGYVKDLSDVVPTYEKIPDVIRNHHSELSMALLARVKQGKYRGSKTEVSIIADLNSCLSGAPKFKVNHEAFTHHTSNFRMQMINDVFARVGVQSVSQRLCAYSPFAEYAANKFPGRPLSSIDMSELFFWINDLAERRNEVAHGPVSNLLSFNLLLEYIDFVEVFGKSLFCMARASVASYAAQFYGLNLGSPIKVYGDHIVCFNLRSAHIVLGDTIVAMADDTKQPVRFGSVESLGINGNSLSEVAANANGIDVGVKVPFRAKVNHTFYVVSKDRWA
jgi:hypothetical protein